MPRGVHDLCRPKGFEPVSFTSKLVIPTSRQTTDYVLCADCEQLLNRHGETWLLPKLANAAGEFAFYDLLANEQPVFNEDDVIVYATATNPEMDQKSLVHFAIGLFWKASVHSWQGGIREPRIDIGSGSEDLRKFLLGLGSIPENMALVIFVMPPPVKLIAFTDPGRGSNPDFANFNCYVPGIFINLCVGDGIRKRMAATCIISNSAGPVIVKDITQDIRDVFRMVSSTAYKTKKFFDDQTKINSGQR